MDLNHRHTRRLFLAGKVAFPDPFPSVGTLSFESGSLTFAKGEPRRSTKFVVVQEPACGDEAVLRAILQRRVAAMFVPGRWSQGRFRVSQKNCATDLEKGEWFLEKDVDPEIVLKRLKLSKGDNVSTRDSILKGIVFVDQRQPVMTITEVVTTAAAASPYDSPTCTCPGCDPFCCRPYCTRFDRCCTEW